jgi:ATP-dependent DNA helicase RecG
VPLILENAPDTSFVEIGGLFVTRFKRPSAVDATSEASGKTDMDIGREDIKTGRETSIESTKAGRETSAEARSPSALAGLATAQKILLHLKAEPTNTAQALAKKIGITEKGVRYHLEQLKKQGRLLRHGPTKAGYWEVIGEDND